MNIGYAEVYDSPVYAVGRTGVEFSLNIIDFLGPGSYEAEGSYLRSSESSSYGSIVSTEKCAVTVTADADGGISGEYTCVLEGLNIAGNAEVQGTFACGHNSIAARRLSHINPVTPTPDPMP